MLVTFLIIVNLLQVITAAVTARQPAKCYDRAHDYYPYYGTRTAYEYVHGNLTKLEDSCTPVQIWMLARHGTRYPSKTVTPKMLNVTALRDQILQNHENGDGLLCSSDLEKLSNWRQNPNFTMENIDMLTEQGVKDLRKLAERLKYVFSDLLDANSAKPGDFVFRATNTERTQQSMKAFARGLFENDESLVQPEKPPVNDTLLTAYDLCHAWTAGDEYDHVNIERDKFTDGPEIRAVRWSVAQRLGFSEALDFGAIKTIYEMCRFETAWYPNRMSTWCLVFRSDELKILEYWDDLNYYYFTGPGRPMSSKIGCQTLSDMFEHFKALATGNFINQPKGVFYFGHTVTLQTLMAALKINNEESKPLLASNFAEVESRNYRTSLFGPFATNIVAVFYRCTKSTIPYKVTIYAAEKLAKIPGCADGVCDWDFFERKFAPDVDQCSMDFCDNSKTHSAATLTYSKFTLPMIVVLGARVILT